jgi:hypothetical protein
VYLWYAIPRAYLAPFVRGLMRSFFAYPNKTRLDSQNLKMLLKT